MKSVASARSCAPADGRVGVVCELVVLSAPCCVMMMTVLLPLYITIVKRLERVPGLAVTYVVHTQPLHPPLPPDWTEGT